MGSSIKRRYGRSARTFEGSRRPREEPGQLQALRFTPDTIILKTTASRNVDRRVDLFSLQLGQDTTNYAFYKCIVEGLSREPASVEEGRDD